MQAKSLHTTHVFNTEVGLHTINTCKFKRYPRTYLTTYVNVYVCFMFEKHVFKPATRMLLYVYMPMMTCEKRYCTCMHRYVLTYMHTCIRTCMHTYISTLIHGYTMHNENQSEAATVTPRRTRTYVAVRSLRRCAEALRLPLLDSLFTNGCNLGRPVLYGTTWGCSP